jgi:hypothetical protein
MLLRHDLEQGANKSALARRLGVSLHVTRFTGGFGLAISIGISDAMPGRYGPRPTSDADETRRL